jgi:hypothetical protein
MSKSTKEEIAEQAASSIDALVKQYAEGSSPENQQQIQGIIKSAIDKACGNLTVTELVNIGHDQGCLVLPPGTFVM